MTRVLIFGSTGQIATELGRANWPADTQLIALDRTAADLSDSIAVAAAIEDNEPAFIINAAAFTAVDKAEGEPSLAYATNALAVEAMAAAAREVGAILIHLSTDYVFDGSKSTPYLPDDKPRPLGVYGRSKLAGEYAALSNPSSIVLRTSWVYSAVGSNFVRTMRHLATGRDNIDVVNDQIGCPTSAADIAAAIVEIVSAGASKPGIFHCAAPDWASWADLATATIELTGNDRTTVSRISTAEQPTPVPRPANSRLDTASLTEAYGLTLRPWREALAQVSRQLDHLEKKA